MHACIYDYLHTHGLFKNVFRKFIVQTPARTFQKLHASQNINYRIYTLSSLRVIYLYAYMHLHAGIPVRLVISKQRLWHFSCSKHLKI
jgi:hypothetical protein